MAARPAEAEDDSFHFRPSDDVLVDRFLRAKIDGALDGLGKNAAYFVDADVCSARPDELVRAHGTHARVDGRDAGGGAQWYFFSTARFVGASGKKRSRSIAGTGGKESWHCEGRPKPVEGSVAGGSVQKFSYHVRTPEGLDKPGWIMAEYSVGNPKEGDTVLCKIYRSPRGPGRRSPASSLSAMSGCKRKAADDLEAAKSSTRQRQVDAGEGDAVMFAAGSLDPNLVSAEHHHHAAAPEFDETNNVEEEESLQEPQQIMEGMMFAGDLERDPLSVEQQNVGGSQLEPQIVPATASALELDAEWMEFEAFCRSVLPV